MTKCHFPETWKQQLTWLSSAPKAEAGGGPLWGRAGDEDPLWRRAPVTLVPKHRDAGKPQGSETVSGKKSTFQPFFHIQLFIVHNHYKSSDFYSNNNYDNK